MSDKAIDRLPRFRRERGPSDYALDRVLRFCHERGHVRPDGRVMRLNGRMLVESHRNTIANWKRLDMRAPLARWDEVLMGVDMMLWEYEDWERDTYGDLSLESATIMDEATT